MTSKSARSLESSPHWPYLAASAVLTNFSAENLRPIGGAEPSLTETAAMIVDFAEPVRSGPDSGRWKLRGDVRRQVLATLGTRDSIRAALDANATNRSSDPAQRALSELVAQEYPIRLAGRPLEDLLGLDRAVEWLGAARVEPLPSREDIRGQIQRERLLEPFHRLVYGFAGRQDETRRLRQYVDQLPSQSPFEAIARFGTRIQAVFLDRPPLVIHGPGGVGKSTLVAKFILDHAGPSISQPMPFVLLDFDRSTLDATRPDAVVGDLATQLAVQFPTHAPRLMALEQIARLALDVEETDQVAVSGHFEASGNLRSELAASMNEIAATSRQNMLLVIDTFEIIQRRGSSAVILLLDFVAELLSQVTRLRVVIVGRGRLRREDFAYADEMPNWEELPLYGFDPVAGRAYLRERLRQFKLPDVSDADLDRIVLRVRGNPLGLRLAAQVFAREGLQGFEDAIGRQRLNEAIAEEQMQWLLHSRIVDHLDNENLQKIANPGLVVRRITPSVIEEVLAGPCKLDLTRVTAEQLFAELRNEVSLVDSVDEDTVRHRPDVRLISLPSLRRELGSLARNIDNAAVDYFQTRPTPAERAEEIYHRLWREDAQSDLEERWEPETARYLDSALDEFQSIAPSGWARIWLTQKLNRELPDELRQHADQVEWEHDVELKARTLLSDRRTAEALRLINERPRASRVPASPLWVLEVDLLLLRGDTDTASSVLAAALERLNDTVDAHHTLALLSRRTILEERLDHNDRARDAAATALDFARAMNDPVSVFACGVSRLRLARKTDAMEDPAMAALKAELIALANHAAVRQALEDRPALLREAAAELGADVPDILADALIRLGLDKEIFGVPAENVVKSLSRFMTTFSKNWPTEANNTNLSDFAASIAESVRTRRISGEVSQAVADLYADSVERLNHQII